MKTKLLYYIKITGILFLSFILLGILSYSLPSERVVENVKESAQKFNNHRNITYPIIRDTMYTHSADYFTEALILNNMVSVPENDIFNSVLLIPRYYNPDVQQAQRMWNQVNYAVEHQHESPNDIYPRYWFGSTFLYRFVLFFTNYEALSWIIYGISTILLLVFLFKLKERFGLNLTLGFVLAFLFVNVYLMQFLMQFSSVLMIALLISILIMNKFQQGKKVIPLFFISGALCVYFDLLTAPVITLGLPLIVYILLGHSEESLKDLFKKIVISSLTWVAGYALLWLMKWVLVYVFTDYNIVSDILYSVDRRIGVGDFTRFDALCQNTMHFRDIVWFMPLILIIPAVMFPKKENLKKSFGLFIVSLYPFLRFLALSDHSYWHHWFTYREMLVFFAAIFSAGVILIDWQKMKQKLICRT